MQKSSDLVVISGDPSDMACVFLRDALTKSGYNVSLLAIKKASVICDMARTVIDIVHPLDGGKYDVSLAASAAEFRRNMIHCSADPDSKISQYVMVVRPNRTKAKSLSDLYADFCLGQLDEKKFPGNKAKTILEVGDLVSEMYASSDASRLSPIMNLMREASFVFDGGKLSVPWDDCNRTIYPTKIDTLIAEIFALLRRRKTETVFAVDGACSSLDLEKGIEGVSGKAFKKYHENVSGYSVADFGEDVEANMTREDIEELIGPTYVEFLRSHKWPYFGF